MSSQGKRAEEWEQFEGWVKQELEKARRRFLLAESFDEIEELAVELGQVFEQELMAAGAKQQEVEGGGLTCPECGVRMKRHGKVPRQIKSSRGEVRFERERWICPECGANLFPHG